MFTFFSTALLAIIHGLPVALAALLVDTAPSGVPRLAALAAAPLVYAAVFALSAALASLPYRASIAPGRLRRDLADPAYRARRLYGLCWTQLYYHKPVYSLVLALPLLKRAVFRLFGYRGALDVTLYPDTWIRDLPLLDVGKGVYVSNRATLGTNMAMNDGTLLVDRIRLGDGVLVGHLAAVGLGAVVEERAEIGVGALVGLRARVGTAASIQPGSILNHFSEVGERAIVGTMALVGLRAKVPAGGRVEPGGTATGRGAGAAA